MLVGISLGVGMAQRFLRTERHWEKSQTSWRRCASTQAASSLTMWTIPAKAATLDGSNLPLQAVLRGKSRLDFARRNISPQTGVGPDGHRPSIERSSKGISGHGS